jgi:hypothetical protein
MSNTLRIEAFGLPAGQRFDALVAEHVMGWKPVGAHYGTLDFEDQQGDFACGVPPDGEHDDSRAWFYPSRGGATWHVVHRMAVKGFDVLIHPTWLRNFFMVDFEDKERGVIGRGGSDSLDVAVCLAALDAVLPK